MAEYESLIHLSRWRRLVIWLCEDQVGYGVATVVVITALCVPMFLFGKWGLAVVAAAILGFWAGYRLASSFAKSGQLPPEV